MPLSDLLNIWRDTPSIAENIVAWRTYPAQAAQTVPFPADLHPALAQSLRSQGIESLYTHQHDTWQQVQAGENPVVVTSPASGKTLCYNLPVLHHLFTNPDTRALYLFPTKALANDQLTNLQLQITNYKSSSPISASTYDGDTPAALRPPIRKQARLLLTNPDMLHTGILPHHTKWANFLSHLRFIIIDEMHVYRGVFGSHVANVLRRLKRIANFYGSVPQFILTSATIANPSQLAEQLIEEPTTLVNNDGAAKGPKHFIVYNPPIVNADLGIRRGTLQESVRLTKELLYKQIQTIVFSRTRRSTELLLLQLRDQLTINNEQYPKGTSLTNKKQKTPNSEPGTENSIRAYRSGYLPHQRREIEQGLRSSRVQAVVATSALELGIDIGSMSAAVLTGYPGTIAGTWQQAGRAGRQDDEAMAVLITSASPLDQFLAQHVDYLFDRSPETALINPNNLLILLQHLRCAAFELPFRVGEPFGRVDPQELAEFLQFLQESGELHQSGQKYFWMADQYPAQQVSLRSASPSKVQLQVQGDDRATTIGEVDIASAPWMVHPQAIYLHEGQSYLVTELDLEQHLAHMQPSSADYYTEPRQETTVQLVEQFEQVQVQGATKQHGELLVTTQVTGYRIIQLFTNHNLGGGDVDLPPTDLHTTGYWLSLTAETVDHLREQNLWSNDPNNYGPNWAKQRNQVRQRDNYRCQMCGAPETGRQHDVHHKIPFRTFNSYREANQLTNLVTLCRTCHGRAETAVRMRSGLSGLSQVLGHLAPLFLMCDTYDVGIHADPQSPLAEGQPAIVIYDMIPAGIGFSQRLFELHNQLTSHALELVATCGCTDGCPSCVGPPGEEGHGGKKETLAILEQLTTG